MLAVVLAWLVLAGPALAQLPEDQAEAVRRRYLDAQPLRDIAQAMARSEQAVAALLKRGLRGLRARLDAAQRP